MARTRTVRSRQAENAMGETNDGRAAEAAERRRVRIEYVPIAGLRPYDNNPRDNASAVEPVAASISQFGFINPVVATMDGEVLAGHTRIRSAVALGIDKIPVVRVDMTADEARAYRLADNRVAEFSRWDMELLAQEADLLKDSGIDLALFGFDTSALADLLAPVPDMADDPEEANAEAVSPRTAVGDLWRLGEHRLLVGDATDAAQVARLMDGETADCWLTDPPYNVAVGDKYAMLERSLHRGSKARAESHIENDDMEGTAFLVFLVAAFRAAADALKPGGSGYVWHADMEGLNFRRAVAEAGLDLKQCLVWVKGHFVISRSDYHWRHEPCLYVRKPGAAHYFTADRTQDTAMESPAPDFDAMGEAELRELLKRILARKNQTVLRYGKPTRSADHPTEKPLGLFAQLVRNSTRRGEIVLDTFAGSGTTLLACEKAGRKARCMELDPKYATVILDRWEAETGREAERIGTAGDAA